MLILSTTPCSRFISTSRVSYSSSSSLSSYYSASSVSLKLNSNSARYILRGKCYCPCVVVYQSKARGMTELVEEDKKEFAGNAAVVALSSAEEEDGEDKKKNNNHPRSFLDAGSEDELLAFISKEAEAGRLPSTVASGMKELYDNYRNAVFQSGDPKADEIILSNMTIAFDRMYLDVKDSYVFSPHHKAMREPFDYYMFGQNYIRPLVDFRNSYVGNISLFYEMEQKLQQGHNIILISNHQTEADPAVIALLLETTNPRIAENVAYIAGDRVLTDPLCKPFSMGRNLICVYSKKHMHDVPELAEMKRRANTRSLKEMALLLRSGSQIIWIAPSGGRDRPDPLTEEWFPAPFDASAVDNIRRLAEHSGVPGHVYPLALLCHDIMPPPLQVEKEIGEKREVSFHGAGLSVAPEINYLQIGSASENPEEAKDAYTQALYNSVTQQYNVLKSAIHGQQGLEASTSSISLSQPWK